MYVFFSDPIFRSVKRKVVPENTQMTFVGAINIGMSSSMYAYSAKGSNDSFQPSMEIKLNTPWPILKRDLRSYKTPTCILLHKNTDDFSFGYDAKKIYSNSDVDETWDLHFLEEFIIQLYQNEVC